MTSPWFDLLGVHDRLIMDPVHGGITLFQEEVAVIDHPLFQRLRHICQNDILSLVFPGATHSRFLHSLGTLHVSSRLYHSLVESCLRTQRDAGLSPSAEQLEGLAYLLRIVRLAGLLHDCGHSSFSHQFTQSETIQALMQRQGRFIGLWADADYRDYYRTVPASLEHEHYSVRVAHEILGEAGHSGRSPLRRDVLALMDTTTACVSDRFHQHCLSLWPLLTGSATAPENAGVLVAGLLSHLISGEVDADRADYMLRDGFHSSVTLGGFNLDHLLQNFHIGWSAEEEWLGLGITPKGLGALEDFVYSRYQMYRKVYGHKTSIGFDWLLRKAIDEVLTLPDARAFIDQCLSDLREFQTLTDNYFWESFRRYAAVHPESASARLIYRQRLEHICSHKDLSEAEVTDLRLRLAEQLNLPPERLICCKMKARFSRIGSDFQDIRVRHTGGYLNITQSSEFFTKFSDQVICHFYRW